MTAADAVGENVDGVPVLEEVERGLGDADVGFDAEEGDVGGGEGGRGVGGDCH